MSVLTDRPFGETIQIPASTILAENELCFAFTNKKPFRLGHMLISPKRVVESFFDLQEEELCLFVTLVQQVGKMLKSYYGSPSLIINVQDGRASGQTVRHVHAHILPLPPTVKPARVQKLYEEFRSKWREDEEMAAEVGRYQAFKQE